MRSTGSTSLTTSAENPGRVKTDSEYLKMDNVNRMGGLQVVIEKDGMTTNTGSGSQDEDFDEDTFGDDSTSKEPIKGAAASAMLLSAFVAETIRIEIPINGNTDSGYVTSQMERETELGICADFASTREVEFAEIDKGEKIKGRSWTRRKGEEMFGEDFRKMKKKSRFNLGRRHKSSRKKREKASAKRERKATKTLAIVLGNKLIDMQIM